MVYYGVHSLSIPALMSVEHLMGRVASSVLAIAWTRLLRKLVGMLLCVYLCNMT